MANPSYPQRGHFKGLTQEALLGLLNLVRDDGSVIWRSGNGKVLYRLGEVVVIEDPVGGGTMLKPNTIGEFIAEFIKNNPQ